MNRLAWESRVALRRIGRIGLIGLLLLGVAGYVHFAEIRPLQHDLSRREAALPARYAALAAPPPPVIEEARDGHGAGLKFTHLLRDMDRIAQEHGVALSEVGYQQVDENEGKLRRYTLTVPFQATYPQMRAFLGEVRRRPGVRLEKLSMAREGIEQIQLEIGLELSYLIAVEAPTP